MSSPAKPVKSPPQHEWALFAKERERKQGRFWPVLLLLLLPALAYAAMFGNPVLWTDYDTVERSGFTALEDSSELLQPETIRSHDPLSLASYFAEKALPFPPAATHRAINLALHVSTALVFFALLRVLHAPGSALAALAFAIHPAAVQAVFWPGYRPELLALFLSLASLTLALRNRRQSDYFGALLLALVASFLHSAALFIPAVLALGILYLKRFPRLPHFNPVLPFVAISLFVGIWTGTGNAPSTPEAESIEQVSNIGENMFFLMQQTALPLELALFHPYVSGSRYGAGIGMSILPFVVFLPLYFLIALRFGTLWSRSLLFSVSTFLLYATYAALQPGNFLDGTIAFETHDLYFALPAAMALIFCHLTGCVRYLARPFKPLWFGFAGLFLILELLLTASFTYALGSPVRMWQSIEGKWPDSWIPKAALVEYSVAGREDALAGEPLIEALNQILEQRPARHDLRVHLARTYVEQGQLNNANREYKRILRETEPSDQFLEEAARFFDRLGLSWDAENARARISGSL